MTNPVKLPYQQVIGVDGDTKRKIAIAADVYGLPASTLLRLKIKQFLADDPAVQAAVAQQAARAQG